MGGSDPARDSIAESDSSSCTCVLTSTNGTAKPLFGSVPASLDKMTTYSQPLQQFRGKVLIRAAHGARCIHSLCILNHKHLTLYGGANWETELVEIPIGHISIDVHFNKPSSFHIKVQSDFEFGLDTRILLTVSSPVARDRWLSVLYDLKASIQGWDASARYRSPAPTSRNFVSSVTWLS